MAESDQVFIDSRYGRARFDNAASCVEFKLGADTQQPVSVEVCVAPDTSPSSALDAVSAYLDDLLRSEPVMRSEMARRAFEDRRLLEPTLTEACFAQRLRLQWICCYPLNVDDVIFVDCGSDEKTEYQAAVDKSCRIMGSTELL